MTGAVLWALGCHAVTLAVLLSALWSERREHARTRAALDAARATVAAAAVLYGEARMREAARVVAMREKAD